MTSFGTSWGGPRSHFFDGFWHPGPKWCPRGLQGEPRGAQSHSKYQFVMIFGRFGVDFEVIWATFGYSSECLSHDWARILFHYFVCIGLGTLNIIILAPNRYRIGVPFEVIFGNFLKKCNRSPGLLAAVLGQLLEFS